MESTKARKRKEKVAKSASGDSKNENNVMELKKELGLFGGIALVVGTMIGSGIFLSPAGILAKAESVGASLCIWAGCGLLSTLSALSYIELGLMIKKSGGEYQYLKVAFGDIIAFLCAWTTIVVTKPSSLAIISIGFSEYVTAPFYPGCAPPTVVQKCAAAFCIVLISSLNCWSVKLSSGVQVIFTVIKLMMIAAIIVSGLAMLAHGHTEQFNQPFAGSSISFSAIALGFYGGLWSYDGWNQLNYVTEEIRQPNKNFPLVIMIAIPLVTICYMLVNIAYFTVMTPVEILSSNAVAVTFGDRVFGRASFLVPFAVACSTFGAANGSAFSGARLTFAAGRNGHMMKVLSYISVTRYTPSSAVIFNALIALVMLIPDASSFSSLIDYFTFSSWLIYGATFLSIIVLRFRQPKWKRPFKVFIGIPVVCVIASLYLVIAPFLDNPSLAYLYAVIFILAGLLFYFPLVHFKKVLPFMDAVTIFIQEVLEIAPTSMLCEDEDSEKAVGEENDINSCRL